MSCRVRGEPSAPPFEYDKCPFCGGSIVFERGKLFIDARCFQAGHSIGDWHRGAEEWRYFLHYFMRRPKYNRRQERSLEDELEEAVEREEREWRKRRDEAMRRRQAGITRNNDRTDRKRARTRRNRTGEPTASRP